MNHGISKVNANKLTHGIEAMTQASWHIFCPFRVVEKIANEPQGTLVS
jgi:hypothetical protein